MTRIVLIQAGHRLVRQHYSPPLGIMCLASFLRERVPGLEIKLIDMLAHQLSADEAVTKAMEYEPEVVVEAQDSEELEVIEDLEPVEEEIMAPAGVHPQPVPTQARIVSVMDGFEFLENTAIFASLSLSEMKQLWNICESKKFEPGAILIEQDKPGHALYIVKAGNVIVQRVESDKVTDLVELGPGAHLGEMSLVDDAPTSARVTSGAEGAEAFEITREKFEELLEADDKIAIKIYKVFVGTLCDRLRKTTAELSASKTGPA